MKKLFLISLIFCLLLSACDKKAGGVESSLSSNDILSEPNQFGEIDISNQINSYDLYSNAIKFGDFLIISYMNYNNSRIYQYFPNTNKIKLIAKFNHLAAITKLNNEEFIINHWRINDLGIEECIYLKYNINDLIKNEIINAKEDGNSLININNIIYTFNNSGNLYKYDNSWNSEKVFDINGSLDFVEDKIIFFENGIVCYSNLEGENIIKLFDPKPYGNVNILFADNSKIYFGDTINFPEIKYYFYDCKTKKIERFELMDNFYDILIYNNEYYFTNSNGQLFKCDKNFKNFQQLTKMKTNKFSIIDGWIYFQPYSYIDEGGHINFQSNIYKLKVDGTKLTKIV